MDAGGYFASLSSEFDVLKDRLGYFVANSHWLTVGEGKESIIRAILTRHLPAGVQAGRGFVIDLAWRSTQIDILLYDNSKPALYREGDLVFVTPEAVKGIIEVKSSVDSTTLKKALIKLANNAEAIRSEVNHDLFVGLFSYELNMGPRAARTVLNRLCNIRTPNKT